MSHDHRPPDAERLAREARQLGATIARIRAQREMTTEELAARACLSPRRLAAIEAGTAKVLLDELVAVTAALGVPPSELFA